MAFFTQIQLHSPIFAARTGRLQRDRIRPIVRRLLVTTDGTAAKDSESHLLPRLYVGPLPESPGSLSQYLSDALDSAGKVSSSMAKKGTTLLLSSDQSHYVTNVMRMIGPGSKKGRWSYQGQQPCIRIFDGNTEWVALLDLLSDLGGVPGKKRPRRQEYTVVAQCLSLLRSKTSSNHQMQAVENDSVTSLLPILCFAPPKKKERFQWILEKSTELGMDAWLLLSTDRTEAARTSARDYPRKGQAYVLEATEQCERLCLPQHLSLFGSGEDDQDVNDANFNDIDNPATSTNSLTSLWDLLDHLSNDQNNQQVSVLICRERSPESTPILQALQRIQSQVSTEKDEQTAIGSPMHHCCMVFVGPEGGWSPAEEDTFDRLCDENSMFWSVSLGGNVLRTDTAAVAAIAAFSFHSDQHQ
ncbi:Specifically methylates the N3 position of the uracil ring of uridine 1498 (m3U1498) in 16S rRNA. Acts on the fully assembled 30S ribosomal subunit (By similarity) [Seminavis robusta]|uniref:16S rRNA (uracil(1498)-N(3))-methyltransferase n=1 Tax=Seminavis robusta TaxID=568900 RepID=A0A9N8I140_9STRA|nr:Specifically methylates the N3 position of the uracil ring of uridine 1498 (m3U1498) in 16S rRNA. Acts on the fully assembled 30S ribosomal subunit (By similarity) [Seminavis robusta]|eukprot:Sro3100_g343720.1 Specifically methylates the N3 position of the uracil ring of uridine 1498 (m3U1498) in 16S rRNA. Acts on the fully assembled 30S ribosomal subunit (By similarity) (414) ;mRNA; r:590-1831